MIFVVLSKPLQPYSKLGLSYPIHNLCRLQYSRAVTSLASVRKMASGFTLSTFSKRYHFPNAGKMIFYHFASVNTSIFSSLDDTFKSFPFGITQHLCKFSCTPTLYAFVFVGDSLELLEQFFDFLFLHNRLFL